MSRLLEPSQHRLSSTLTAMGHRMGYLPPEACRLEEEQYDYSLDVFSLGAILVQIVHKLETVKTPNDRMYFVVHTAETHVLKPLIDKCLQEDMNRRPGASRVCYELTQLINAEGQPEIPTLIKSSKKAMEVERDSAILKSNTGREKPMDELKPPLNLKWRRGKNMLFKIGGAIESVVIGNYVYVGGGSAYCLDRCGDCSSTVMKLDLELEHWTKLKQYSVVYFAITLLNNQLAVVGGRDRLTGKPTNQMSVFAEDIENGEWIPYPPMKVARDSSTAVSFNNHIIVAGGWGENVPVDSVEIFNPSSEMWYTADPLPSPRAVLKSVLLQGILYLVGGWDKSSRATSTVNTVDCNKLIDKAISSTSKQTHTNLWQAKFIQDTPHYFTSPFTVRGSLLVIGGRTDKLLPSSSVYLYQPETGSWMKVGELSRKERYYCTCSELPNGEVIVAGGYDGADLKIVDFLSIA